MEASTMPSLVTLIMNALDVAPGDEPLIGMHLITPDQLAQLVRKKICAACHKEFPEAKICSRCKVVNYCSGTCQKSHWAAHKAICKEPCETTLVIEARNLEGPITRKEVPYAIHRLEDTRQPFARKVGAEAVKAEKYADLDGNFMNYHLVDALFLVELRSVGRCTNVHLMAQGYRGLKRAGDQQLQELLAKEDYYEILKFVWTEQNDVYKIAWLREQSEKGHVILMFETARALAESKKMPEATILEAFKWRHLGEIRTLIDAACFEDPTVKRVMESIEPLYSIDHLLKPLSAAKKKSILMQISSQRGALLSNLRIENTDPSPRWLLFRGAKSYKGINTLRSPEQWIEQKKLSLAQIVALFKQVNQEKK